VARIGSPAYLPGMMQHTPSIAFWISILSSTAAVAIPIFATIWRAKHPRSHGFDFVESARRIRGMPIPSRDDA
jgi:hypothetical protein